MQPFTVGQKISLTFPLPKSQRSLKIEGEIAWAGSQGIGVKFKSLRQPQEEMVKALLETI